MLTTAQIEAFERDGFIALRGVFARETAAACMDLVWEQLAAQGVDRDDRSSWSRPVVRIVCPPGAPFVEAGSSAQLWEAFAQLIGPHIETRYKAVGGTIPVRFPSESDPGDAGWHVEGSYEGEGGYWLNVHSRVRGLLALYLLTDVSELDAPTGILVGSHLDVPALLEPAGEAGMHFQTLAPKLPRSTFQRQRAHATGRAGDVYVCHPFIVHRATFPHRGRIARAVAQPGIGITEPYALTGAASEVPVERAILRGLSRSA